MVQCNLRNLKYRVEVPILLLFFAYMFSDAVSTNFILFRTCYVTLGYNESICRTLITNLTDNSSKTIENTVQIHASYILTTCSILENIFPAILCLLFGPWSDKYGRKPLMILPLTAFGVSYLCKVLIALIPTLSPWFLIGCSLSAVITGGFATYFTSVLCYITDVSSQEYRGVRMALAEAAMGIGICAGTLASSYAFKAIDFVGVFIIASMCMFLGALYTIFIIPESIPNSDPFCAKAKDLFRIDHIKSMIHTTFKKREYHLRAILLCIIAVLVINVLNINGDGNVMYLYIREKFHWDLKHWTFYTAGRSVCGIFGAIIGVYVLHKIFHVPEQILMVLGFSCGLTGVLIVGLAIKEWQLYLAAVIRSLSSVLSPMMRSLISKLVPVEEIGKIFPITLAIETFLTLLGAPLYTAIYDETINSFPGAFNFFTAGINVVCLVITVIVVILRRYQPTYSCINNVETIDSNNSINTS